MTNETVSVYKFAAANKHCSYSAQYGTVRAFDVQTYVVRTA